ncbi:zinc-binding dehydrogenase [Candidatus Poribacteria bacterium]
MANGNRAAIFCGTQDIRIEDRKIPVPESDEVLIRSTDACICATEVKYWYHGMPGIPEGTRVVQGHELGGIVEDAGSDVRNRGIIGAKVAVDPSLWCGVCDMCKAGMSNLCRKLQFMSLPPVDGGYQQFYRVPERNIHPIPEDVPAEWSSMVEPVSIGINAISDAERIVGSLSGKTIAVVGAGPQGLLLMQTATAMSSPRKICVLEPLDYRRQIAKELGADEIIDPQTEDPVSRALEMTNGMGIDVVFEVAGEADSYQLAATLAKPSGTVVIVGIPAYQEYIPIQAITARRAGLTLKFIRRFNPKDFPRAVDMIAAGEVEVASLITHCFSLDEITPAFEMLHDYSDGVIKTIIRPHD